MDISLSAILVVGRSRERAQACLDALSLQTASEEMEIVLVDIAPEETPPLESGAERIQYLRRHEKTPWSQVRAEAVKRSRAPVVAFIEDHCLPSAGWAEALIEAHKGPWAAVGYAFTNGSADTYLFRSMMMAEYGFWMSPVHHGRTNYLPGNNVSYKRDLLLSFGEQLEQLIAVDFNVQEALRQRGHELFTESRALTAHQFYASVPGLLRANGVYARLLAANRAKSQSWGFWRRLLYGVSVPLAVPVLRLVRLGSDQRQIEFPRRQLEIPTRD